MSDIYDQIGGDPSPIDVDYQSAMMEKSTQIGAAANETLPIRLRRQLVQSQKETARLKRLIELLEENPATNEILQLLGKHY